MDGHYREVSGRARYLFIFVIVQPLMGQVATKAVIEIAVPPSLAIRLLVCVVGSQLASILGTECFKEPGQLAKAKISLWIRLIADKRLTG